MILRVLNFLKLPFVLITIYAVLRFIIGASGVPYAPRGNAMFSVLGVTLISCVYFGALSGKVGGFSWGGAALIGLSLGLFSQILIFLATFISYAGGFTTSYYIHWDALNLNPANFNVPLVDALMDPGKVTEPMGKALVTRASGLVFNSISATIVALIGRALAGLAPRPHSTN